MNAICCSLNRDRFIVCSPRLPNGQTYREILIYSGAVFRAQVSSTMAMTTLGVRFFPTRHSPTTSLAPPPRIILVVVSRVLCLPWEYKKTQGGLGMPYRLEGRLLEVCDCRVLCPCWIGEDPDNGTCESMQAWHFDKGQIDGVDVTGRTIAASFHIPGNVLKGGFKAALYIDDGASDDQQQAILDVWGGKRGGPVAELAKLVSEVVSVERVPITFAVDGGRGTLRIGDAGFAELEPYRGPNGAVTTLADTIFSTVPGAPVFVGKATRYRSKNPKLGHDVELSGHNALQSTFVFDG
jgi:hypothetical protein